MYATAENRSGKGMVFMLEYTEQADILKVPE